MKVDRVQFVCCSAPPARTRTDPSAMDPDNRGSVDNLPPSPRDPLPLAAAAAAVAVRVHSAHSSGR